MCRAMSVLQPALLPTAAPVLLVRLHSVSAAVLDTPWSMGSVFVVS